jgi:hydrogenase nickel incorporation protein HypA/HybF
MHEVSVVATLVDAVIKELSKYKVTKVNSVTVVIGEMTNLGKEQMTFAYEIVTRGTILEGSEFIIEPEPIEVQCNNCGYIGPVKVISDPDFDSHSVPVLACPECGGSIKVIKGQSCVVRCMDIEEEEE